jgi:hypothetical protein
MSRPDVETSREHRRFGCVTGVSIVLQVPASFMLKLHELARASPTEPFETLGFLFFLPKTTASGRGATGGRVEHRVRA